MKNTLIKGVCLALILSATSIFAPSAKAIENSEGKVLISHEKVNVNLEKIDTTEAGVGELYVDTKKLKGFQIVIDDVVYNIEDGVLVEDEVLVKDEKLILSDSTIMPLALGTDSYSVSLANGEMHTKYKMVYQGSTILFQSLGDPVKREIVIFEGQLKLASYMGSENGIAIMATPDYTGPVYFSVQNFSANRASWVMTIRF